MMQIQEDLKRIGDDIKTTSAFLFEWQNKMGYQLFIMKGPAGNNYAVFRDNSLHLWARPFDAEGTKLFVFSREQLAERMGLSTINRIEASLNAAPQPLQVKLEP